MGPSKQSDKGNVRILTVHEVLIPSGDTSFRLGTFPQLQGNQNVICVRGNALFTGQILPLLILAAVYPAGRAPGNLPDTNDVLVAYNPAISGGGNYTIVQVPGAEDGVEKKIVVWAIWGGIGQSAEKNFTGHLRAFTDCEASTSTSSSSSSSSGSTSSSSSGSNSTSSSSSSGSNSTSSSSSSGDGFPRGRKGSIALEEEICSLKNALVELVLQNQSLKRRLGER